jgi:hypothetical protein
MIELYYSLCKYFLYLTALMAVGYLITVDVERTECTKQGKILHHMLGKGKDC